MSGPTSRAAPRVQVQRGAVRGPGSSSVPASPPRVRRSRGRGSRAPAPECGSCGSAGPPTAAGRGPCDEPEEPAGARVARAQAADAVLLDAGLEGLLAVDRGPADRLDPPQRLVDVRRVDRRARSGPTSWFAVSAASARA